MVNIKISNMAEKTIRLGENLEFNHQFEILDYSRPPIHIEISHCLQHTSGKRP